MKVSVIGAGPSGCIVAASALEENPAHSVIVYEEHKKLGFPEQCGGLLSKVAVDWFQEIGVDCRKIMLNRIKGIALHYKEKNIIIKDKETKAFVVQRAKFDQSCAEFAEKRGAKIKLGEKLTSKNIRELFSNSFIIGADGPFSRVAKTFNFPNIKNYAIAYQADITNLNLNFDERNNVQVFLYDKSFSWLIPINEERTHAGIIFFGNPDFRKFAYFLDDLKLRFDKKELKIKNFFSDCVPFSSRSQIQRRNVYLVGDAAGQVKATSGGGVYYGCKSALLAGKTIETGDYEKRWKKEIGNDLEKHLVVRKILNSINPDTTQLLLSVSSLLGIESILKKYDMERIQSIFQFKSKT